MHCPFTLGVKRSIEVWHAHLCDDNKYGVAEQRLGTKHREGKYIHRQVPSYHRLEKIKGKRKYNEHANIDLDEYVLYITHWIKEKGWFQSLQPKEIAPTVQTPCCHRKQNKVTVKHPFGYLLTSV